MYRIQSASQAPAAAVRLLLVIFNPTAGARRRHRLHQVVATLRELGVSVEVRETGCRGDAEALARAVDPALADVLVVAGGDGTINEAINGLAARAAAGTAPPLGIVPLGTANVLAHELGLPSDPPRVARLLAAGPVRHIHLGVANGRWFSMMAGVGLDARVVARTPPAFKRRVGKAAYAVETQAQILAGPRRLYRVAVDGTDLGAVASVIIAKGHYYGGRFVCAPQACLEAPRLEVCLFPRAGRWNALRYSAAMVLGVLHRLPDYRVVSARRVTVTGPVGEVVQGDGDLIARLPLEVGVAPWRLAVLAPGGDR